MATRAASAPERQPLWHPEDVPPFPAVALKALNMMAGTDTSLRDLCDLIRSDPAFSTEVLRLANSPLVAFSRDITNVLQASMLLGFRRLRSLVIAVGLRAYLAEPFTPLLRSCWRHSLACATIAERATKACLLDKDFAFTSGVMHDVGRVVLVVSMPGEYARLTEFGAEHPRDLLPLEREFCGLDHCQAGAILVKEWALPEVFTAITSCHHDAGGTASSGASMVGLACQMADVLGFGVEAYRNPGSYEQIVSAFPEEARSCFPEDGRELGAEILREIALLESE